MKCFGIFAMTLLMTMAGCKNEMGTQYRECFENDDAASLKDVIDIMTNTQVRRKTARTLTSLLPSMDRMRQTMFSNTRL